MYLLKIAHYPNRHVTVPAFPTDVSKRVLVSLTGEFVTSLMIVVMEVTRRTVDGDIILSGEQCYIHYCYYIGILWI